jgi:hypothetical protein
MKEGRKERELTCGLYGEMDGERKWADLAEAAAPDIFPKYK